MPVNPNSFWLPLLLIEVRNFSASIFLLLVYWQRRNSPGNYESLAVCALSGICCLVAPSIIFLQGTSSFSLINERFWAGLIATAIAWRTKNMILTIS